MHQTHETAGGASFHAPNAGFRTWVDEEGALLVWTGTDWSDLSLLISLLQNLTRLGIGTEADAENPLAAKLNKALFTARYADEGGDGDLRVTMNKEEPAATVSLLFQDDYDGRAEIGLAGDDDLVIKVSPDGTSWAEAVRIDTESGALTLIEKITSLVDESGQLLEHNAGAADEDGVLFRLQYAPTPFTNGPSGEENYTDYIWQLGFNMEPGGAQTDAEKPSLYLQWESRYYQDIFASEFHLQHVSESGARQRALSWFIPLNGSPGSIGTLRGDTLNFQDWAGNSYFQLQAGAGNLDLPLVIRKTTNNTNFIQQKNSAGSFLNLLKLDASDRARIEAPIIVTGAMPSSGTFVEVAGPSGAASGNKLMTLAAPTVTGTIEGLRISGAPTSGLFQQIFNADTTNGTAFARLQIGTGGASGGDPHVYLTVNGVTNWSVGIDNSDGDKFKISKATSPSGGNDRIAIDDNAVAFGLPPRLPSYTVSGLPAASTAGAGAVAFVSNESGGAVPAFSDGTDWRRVTDRAVVS